MKLLLDTCLSLHARGHLESCGHEVVCSGDWPTDPGDAAILNTAQREERVLVTLDKDFGGGRRGEASRTNCVGVGAHEILKAAPSRAITRTGPRGGATHVLWRIEMAPGALDSEALATAMSGMPSWLKSPVTGNPVPPPAPNWAGV